MGQTLETVAPIVLAIAATALGAPELGLAAGGIGSAALGAGTAGLTKGIIDYSHTHDFGSSLKNGAVTAGGSLAGSELGSALGSSLSGATGGTAAGTAGGSAGGSAATGATTGINAGSSLGNFLNNSVGQNIGLSATQSLPGNTLSGTISNAIGDYAPSLGQALGAAGTGSTLGALAGGQLGDNLTTPVASHGPWQPTQQPGQALPSSLSGIRGLSPQQQASYIASQGVFGGGNGGDENSYFSNLLNRQLTNPDRSTNSMSTLQPIENTYLQKLGLGGQSNPTSLLQSISQWNPQA